MQTTQKPSQAARLPSDPVVWVAAALFAAAMIGLSLARYGGFNAGMLDLGNMFQAVSSVLRGQPLVLTSSAGNVSRLAGHVELIYYAFAPLVALWPDPRVLLVGQALLAASGAIPVYRLAMRRLESRLAARVFVLSYLLYPVALTALLFDFHGDTLAMPLLLWALDAIDRHDRPATALWLGLSMLCKVYVALPVAAIGAVLFLFEGRRREGLVIAGAAVLYGGLVFLALRPLFEAVGERAPIANNYVGHYFGALSEIPQTLGPRLINGLIVFGPALLLATPAWRWLLPSLPLVGAALISTGPGGVYDYRYHHYAVAVPFLVLAMIAGAAHRRAAAQQSDRPPRRNWQADVVFSGFVVLLLSVLLVDQPLNPRFWMGLPGIGIDPSAYGITGRDRVKAQFLAEHARPGEPMVASMFLGPRIADRPTLYVARYSDDPGGKRLPGILPQVDAAIVDALFDWRMPLDGAFAGGAAYERAEIGLLLREPGFGLVAARDGLLLFRRNAPPVDTLAQAVATAPDDGRPAITRFGSIELVEAQITPLEGRRYSAAFTWRRTGEAPPAVAVSRLEGLPDARFVHLPTYALLPVGEWPSGQLVLERFTVELPADAPPGGYTWRLGWYDLRHSEAYASDVRSRIGEEVVVGAVDR